MKCRRTSLRSTALSLQGLHDLAEWAQTGGGSAVAVEVGTATGEGAAILAAYYKRLVCVDPLSPEHLATFTQRVLRTRQNVEWRDALSPEAASAFANATLDLVYLDACPQYAAVSADIAAWLPKVRAGGVLAGGNFRPRRPGIIHAVGDLAESLGQELTRFPDNSWAFRIA